MCKQMTALPANFKAQDWNLAVSPKLIDRAFHTLANKLLMFYDANG